MQKYRIGQKVKVKDGSPCRTRRYMDVVVITHYCVVLNNWYWGRGRYNPEYRYILTERDIEEYTWKDAVLNALHCFS